MKCSEPVECDDPGSDAANPEAQPLVFKHPDWEGQQEDGDHGQVCEGIH